jgi:ribosomal protein S18 acetylase RimI-like enzyme
MKDITIRSATESDIPAIVELSREGFNYDWQFDKTLDLHWPDTSEAFEYFRSCISNDTMLALVACKETTLVGYLVAGLTEASFYRRLEMIAELSSMIVTASERCNGIGKSLVLTFFDWCRDKQATRVRVEATTANLRAINFYGQCGFTEYSSILEGDLTLRTNKA